MNLQQTVKEITGLAVTEEEAMAYARDNFDALVSHLRSDLWETLKEESERQRNVISGLESSKEELEKALRKMCEYHEKQATWDKGDNGYYAAKRLLNKDKM